MAPSALSMKTDIIAEYKIHLRQIVNGPMTLRMRRATELLAKAKVMRPHTSVAQLNFIACDTCEGVRAAICLHPPIMASDKLVYQVY